MSNMASWPLFVWKEISAKQLSKSSVLDIFRQLKAISKFLSLEWGNVKGANTSLKLHYELSFTLIAQGQGGKCVASSSLTQCLVSQVGVNTSCFHSVVMSEGSWHKCWMPLIAPSRHPEEEKLNTCTALRAYDFCPKSGRPGIHFLDFEGAACWQWSEAVTKGRGRKGLASTIHTFAAEVCLASHL